MAHIKCVIQTKQFEGSRYKYHMKKQSGIFNPVTLLFVPDENPMNDKGKVGKHSVQFHCINDFVKSIIK